jgi:hypothetical protein
MKNIISVIVLLSAIVIVSSCGSQSPTENDLKYELVTFQKQTEGCDGVRDDNCAKIKIEFPQITSFENEIVKEKINNTITKLFSMNESIDAQEIDFNAEMDAFIDDYESFTKEFPDSYQSWFIERTSEVKMNRENIFSIDFMDYSFTGGAHPNTFVTFKNFDLSDGEEISLDKIISKDKQNELTSIAEAEFRKLKELTSEADLGQAGFWFENNKFYLNENFLIGDSSLVFYYNNYEITAYAFGPTELEIQYSKIKNLINENSLIANLVD